MISTVSSYPEIPTLDGGVPYLRGEPTTLNKHPNFHSNDLVDKLRLVLCCDLHMGRWACCNGNEVRRRSPVQPWHLPTSYKSDDIISLCYGLITQPQTHGHDLSSRRALYNGVYPRRHIRTHYVIAGFLGCPFLLRHHNANHSPGPTKPSPESEAHQEQQGNWGVRFPMSTELAYYRIYNGIFGKSMQIGSEDALHGYHRARDVDDRVITANPSFDPVEILPPELSLRCLLDSLPSGGRLYQSELLQMLNVSERWYHYMISAPLLWSEIHIDLSAADLLATLAAFTHFSGAVPLNVSIWGNPGIFWTQIGDILWPHSPRIRSLRFIATVPPFERETHISWSKEVLGSFQSLSGLQELDFYVMMDLHSLDLDSPSIPRGLLIMSPLNISSLQVDSPMVSLRNYASITTNRCLDDIIPLLCLLSVRDVALYGEKVAQRPTSNIKLPLEAASHLTSIRYHQPYCTTLDRLLRVTAHQLSYLELRIGHSTTQEMIDVLSQLVTLKRLQLHSGDPTLKTAPTVRPSCGTVIHSLSTLHIMGGMEEVLDSLCMVFTTMYPSVRDVVFVTFSNISSICLAYLASLASIKSLHLYDGTEIASAQPMMHLPSLQSLSALAYHTLQYFKLPNLLALTIRLRGGSSRFDIVRLPSLRRLTIDSQGSDLELHLEPSNYPALRSLTLSYTSLRWQLSSLPKVISMTLDSSISDGHNGTLFCAALLYNPECCPALQQISFSQPIEWDILFLMLERRNQETKGVSRINTVKVPFVPFILRKSLALLLEGRSGERPSNLELSFEGAREILCDATIPGCFLCLRHMRPHCLELVISGPDSLPLKLENILVEYPDPPGDIPTEIGDWVVRYRHLREEWKHLEILRMEYCDLWY